MQRSFTVSSLKAHKRVDSEFAMLRIMVELEIYRRRTGNYPSDLKQLIPSQIKEIPFDNFGNQPFAYFTDSKRQRYQLHSAGPNGQNEVEGFDESEIWSVDDLSIEKSPERSWQEFLEDEFDHHETEL